MPTLAGLKNRGVPPTALKKFCADVGVAKGYSVVKQAQLDECIRDELNLTAERAMAVVNPVKLTITNYSGEEELTFEKNPLDEKGETRSIKFSGSVYIDRDDFALNPPPKYKRLTKGANVRLKAAYIVRCDDVVLDEKGEVTEILCTYFPETRSGSDIKTDIKAKGVIHWVDAKYGLDATFRRYQPLLNDEEYPDQDYAERLNKNSESVYYGKAEPYIGECEVDKPFQFMRTGYYKKAASEKGLVLSEIVTLKDNFNK
jgi:glutaminyl-tRNA synthetase